MSLMTHHEIEHAYKAGAIVVDPFDPRSLGAAQYDVRLGEHFWVQDPAFSPRIEELPMWQGKRVYNPYSEEHTRTVWRRTLPVPATGYLDKPLVGVGPEEKILLLHPGARVLGHTEEFIGSASPHITTMIKARSSLGRVGLTVALCAGMGDHGYHSRWTLEISNLSPMVLPLVVGRRIGQVLFFHTSGIGLDHMYNSKYQDGSDPWTPEDMLPKLHLDRESRAAEQAKAERFATSLASSGS